MDDWEDDLLALAEAPAPKKKKSKSKKRKRESSGSASDMDVSEGEDVDAVDSGDGAGSEAGGQPEAIGPQQWTYEGIYKDAAEKERLMQLTELERESILEERREQLQNFQNRQQLRQMMEQTSRESPVESDARPRRKTGKEKQLDELKRRRKVKSEREEKRTSKADGEDEDDEEEEGEESEGEAKQAKQEFDYTDDEEDEPPSDSAAVQADEQVTRETLAQIVLKRGHLAKLWPAPIFADMVEGAYVRMGVGQERGQPVYRLAQITGVAERTASKYYKLEQDMTNIKLVLAIGKDKRDFTMEMVSNTEVTDREFDRYMKTLDSAGIKRPTKSQIEKKAKTLAPQLKYTRTEADISLILAKKKEARAAQGEGSLHDRHHLFNERDIAMRSRNFEAVSRINGLLEESAEASPAETREPMLSSTEAKPVNGAGRAPLTLEERRRTLAAGAGVGGTPPSKVNGGRGGPPSKDAGTPAAQPIKAAHLSDTPPQASPNKENASQPSNPAPTRFQELLASKVEIDLGDF